MFALRLFIIELKKMFFALPKIAIGFLVSIIFASAVCFATVYYINLSGEDFKSSISVYVSRDDKFFALAINAFENSGKIKDLYKIEKENNEESVRDAVESGRSTAGIIFDEDFVSDIIRGRKDIPIDVYISNKDLVLKNAVMKFADCYKSILENVQAGIFSAEKVYSEQTGQKLSSEYNRNINIEYIDFVFSKHKYFDFADDGGNGIIKYYISMLFPLFLLLLSIMAGAVLYSYKKSFYVCAECDPTIVAFVHNIVLFILTALITAFLILIVYIIGFDIYINIIPLIFAVFSLSVISNTVFFISNGNINGGLVLFFAALFFSFLGGAIIPPTFFPEWIKEIYTYSPIYVIGSQFSSLFDSEYLTEGIFYEICIWFLCYFAVIAFRRKI